MKEAATTRTYGFLSNCLKGEVTDQEAPGACSALHLIALLPRSVDSVYGCVCVSKPDRGEP
jgi:hypothetical protein